MIIDESLPANRGVLEFIYILQPFILLKLFHDILFAVQTFRIFVFISETADPSVKESQHFRKSCQSIQLVLLPKHALLSFVSFQIWKNYYELSKNECLPLEHKRGLT